jgi:hypothetical protein
VTARSWAGLLVPFLGVALICAMAMHITGRDNVCSAAGGRLEFSTRTWSGAACVRDGQVIEP